MPHTLSDDTHLDRLARRRAKAKMGWWLHAAIYLVVNTALVALALAQGRHWAVFPLLGWGAGLAFHGLAVWVFAPGQPLMERMVARERQRLHGTGRR